MKTTVQTVKAFSKSRLRLKPMFFIYALLIVMTALYGVFRHNQQMYAICFTLCLVPAFSVPYILLKIRRLRVSFSDSMYAFKGDSVDFNIFFENGSRFKLPSVALFVRLDNGAEFKLYSTGFRGKKKETVCFHMDTRYAGPRFAVITGVSVPGLLGGIEIFTCPNIVLKYAVLPKNSLACYYHLPGEQRYKKSYADKNGQRDERFDYRDYRDGDEVKDINWKLSARGDDIYAANYAADADSALVVVLNDDNVPTDDCCKALEMTDSVYELLSGILSTVPAIAAVKVIKNNVTYCDNDLSELLRRVILAPKSKVKNDYFKQCESALNILYITPVCDNAAILEALTLKKRFTVTVIFAKKPEDESLLSVMSQNNIKYMWSMNNEHNN